MPDGLNGYKWFYRSKSGEVWAKNSYEAQTKAAVIAKAKKSHEVTVVLCERADGSTVEHTATS